ncbi:MAG: hypothetical protein Q7W16_08850 [Coriobacteriia bacterium]|nr:hypothetical protein [Coriobacteriia bacterium]
MNVAANALADLAMRSGTEDGSLVRTVVNSSSTTEAGFAVGLLGDTMPQRSLLAALNLREVLRELPESPFIMRTDFETLARVSGLVHRKQSWVKRLGRGKGAPEIELLGQGNLCYDVIIRAGDGMSFLKPGPINGDLIKPDALELLFENEGLLREIVDLMQDMGVVHNPRFYMTVEDWQMEHAAESMAGLVDLF